jgi:aryl-alcohol dehydrogenase-like predicted oxidoreductase
MYLDNEDLVGKWFQRTGKRDEIFLASKFGIVMDMPKFEFKGIDNSAEYCRKACETSLKRLGVDSIDLCKLLTRKFETYNPIVFY